MVNNDSTVSNSSFTDSFNEAVVNTLKGGDFDDDFYIRWGRKALENDAVGAFNRHPLIKQNRELLFSGFVYGAVISLGGVLGWKLASKKR